LASPYFLTAQNLTNIMSQIAIISILAIGQTYVILTGGIDLSIGNTLGFISMLLALVMRDTGSIFLGVAICILGGLFIGMTNGLLVSYVRIPAFIVTLGMSMITRSADYLVCNGRAVSRLVEGFDQLTHAAIFGILRYYYIGIVILYILMSWILANTKLGRYTYAIGSNENATRLAGVNTKQFKVFAYVISGLMSAIGAIIIASRLGAVDPNYGEGYEMDTLAAVVIGGSAMTGGKGTILGTAIGVIFLGLIKNGLDILGVSPYWQGLTVGVIIILALVLDRVTSREKKH
jgi:ribose transport system permease protein